MYARRRSAHKSISYSTGNITVNTSGWEELAAETGGPGTGGFDLTLIAAAGDVLVASVVSRWNNEAVNGYLDVVTRVSGANTNWFSGGGGGTHRGIAAWYGTASSPMSIGGGMPYTVVAGDVVSNQVTCRLMTRTETATNKILVADPTSSFRFMVENIGPAQP